MEGNMEEQNLTYYAIERQSRILDYINESKRVSVNDLVSHFHVSPSTIRNDLAILKKNGEIYRTHGGAMALSLPKVGLETNTDERMARNLSKKESIAKVASEQIDDGDTIALLAGTTIFSLAKCLVDKKNLTIVVNDLQVAYWLNEHTDHRLFIVGGFVRKGFHCMNFDPSMINFINVDKIFLSCTAFSVEKGAMVPDLNLAMMERCILERAEKVFLLCDSSKFGEVSFMKVIGVEDIDVLITDSDLSKLHRDSIEAIERLELMIAP
jgi:DeoR/GlpR family transcriptional regulator of sugar metabolism